MSQKAKPILGMMLLLGLGLRLVSLNQSLWLDEAIQWWAVTSFSLKELLVGYMKGDFNPPGHHLLMWFWVRVFGNSEVVLRAPSVLFGVGTVWFVHKITNSLDLKRSELAATLVAVNGLLIYYSQEARMYAMATFFVTAAMDYFIKLNKIDKASRTNYFLYVVCLAGALYSHYLTWLLLPFLALWGRRFLLPVGLTLPWWPMLVKQLQAGLTAADNPIWAGLSQTNLNNLSLVLVKFVTGRVMFPESLVLAIGVISVTVLFWGLTLAGVYRVWQVWPEKKKHRDVRCLLVYWAFGPLILGAVIGLFIQVFSYFRFLFVLPAVLMLIGNLHLNRVKELILVAMMTMFSLLYLLKSDYHRENWRGAVAELQRQDLHPVVLIHPAVKPPFDYYDQGNSLVLPSTQLLTFKFKLPTATWYIPYAQPIFDRDDSVRDELRNRGFERTFERHFRGVTLERWTSHDQLAGEREI